MNITYPGYLTEILLNHVYVTITLSQVKIATLSEISDERCQKKLVIIIVVLHKLWTI